jgi:hypothetical protein
MAGRTYFTEMSRKTFIPQTQGQYPSSRITWDKNTSTFTLDENFENAPVTCVTLDGAKA